MTTDAPAPVGTGGPSGSEPSTSPIPSITGTSAAARPRWAELFGPELRALTVGLILLLGSNAFEIIGSATAMPAVLDDVVVLVVQRTSHGVERTVYQRADADVDTPEARRAQPVRLS